MNIDLQRYDLIIEIMKYFTSVLIEHIWNSIVFNYDMGNRYVFLVSKDYKFFIEGHKEIEILKKSIDFWKIKVDMKMLDRYENNIDRVVRISTESS